MGPHGMPQQINSRRNRSNPRDCLVADAPRDSGEILGGRTSQGTERWLTILHNVDAIGEERVVMDIEIGSAAVPLDGGDRSRLCVLNRFELELPLGLSSQPTEDARDEDIEDGAASLAVVGEDVAHGLGHGEDILPDGNVGDDVFTEVDLHLCHAPAHTARAKAALLAAPGNTNVSQ